jgi:hypothetical protein
LSCQCLKVEALIFSCEFHTKGWKLGIINPQQQ